MQVEIDLVRRAKKGDDQAFEQIYEQMYKEMYRYAYYTLGHEEDAKDVVSETVLDIYRGMKKQKEDEKFAAWAFHILTVKCKMKRKAYIDKTAELEENLPASEMDLDQRHDVAAAFYELSEEEQQVVALSVFGGYKSHEVGEELGLKPATVRSKLSRALEKMQNRLQIQECSNC